MSRGAAALCIALGMAASLMAQQAGGDHREPAPAASSRYAELDAEDEEENEHLRGKPAEMEGRLPIRAAKKRSLPLARPGARKSPRTAGTVQSLFPVIGSLAIVLGLFFSVAWLLRRGMPAGGMNLPSEVIEVLGKTTLAGRQQLHLLRCGNKLLLVSFTASGAETLTEITDPAEVDRLAGLCHATHPQSATAAFRQVFQQFSGERNAGGFAGTVASPSRSRHSAVGRTGATHA